MCLRFALVVCVQVGGTGWSDGGADKQTAASHTAHTAAAPAGGQAGAGGGSGGGAAGGVQQNPLAALFARAAAQQQPDGAHPPAPQQPQQPQQPAGASADQNQNLGALLQQLNQMQVRQQGPHPQQAAPSQQDMLKAMMDSVANKPQPSLADLLAAVRANTPPAAQAAQPAPAQAGGQPDNPLMQLLRRAQATQPDLAQQHQQHQQLLLLQQMQRQAAAAQAAARPQGPQPGAGAGFNPALLAQLHAAQAGYGAQQQQQRPAQPAGAVNQMQQALLHQHLLQQAQAQARGPANAQLLQAMQAQNAASAQQAQNSLNRFFNPAAMQQQQQQPPRMQYPGAPAGAATSLADLEKLLQAQQQRR